MNSQSLAVKNNLVERARGQQPAHVQDANPDRREGENLWQRCKAELGVWTKSMLRALVKGGPKGNKWFSLIDKVGSERTLGIAWERVRSTAGACGVDRVSVARFEKDSKNPLLTVKD